MDRCMKRRLKSMLIEQEELKRYLYKDHLGNTTIGIGYHIGKRGLPVEIIHELCDRDLDYHWLGLHQYPWFPELNEDRQMVLMNMRFQLGERRFSTFKKMLAALAHKDYLCAAHEMLDSLYARQVPQRAKALAKIMREGKM